jgi:ankyrin repeat protein
MKLLALLLPSLLLSGAAATEEDTHLFDLVSSGNTSALEPLLDPSTRNAIHPVTKLSLLMHACVENQTQAVALLLSANADVNLASGSDEKNMFKPFDGAAFKGLPLIAKLLLDFHAPCNDPGADGYRPLHRAAWGPAEGHAQVVELLLTKCPNVNVNAAAGSGLTALQIAARTKKNSATIKILLEHGARTDMLTADELETIGTKKKKASNNVNEDLMNAANRDDLKSMLAALENGADVNYQDPTSKQTALMTAALRGRADIVEELLSKWNADPTIGEQQGYTPFHGAGFQGRAEVAKVLLKHGLDPMQRHVDGYTPLHRACWGKDQRHADFLRVILEHGAGNPNVKTLKGETPLMMVRSHSKNKAAAKVLMEFNADTAGLSAKDMKDLGLTEHDASGKAKKDREDL